jgi:hypothetical protein
LLCAAGRAGVGKTAVSVEVSSQLKQLRIGHCRIDGDWLDLAYPQAPGSLFDDNFRALWANYRAHGCTRLIYSNWASIRNLDRVESLMAVPLRVTAVLLLGNDATATERLRSRESGSDLVWHLDNQAQTPPLERTMDALTPGFATRIETDDRTVADVAADVLAATGWAPGNVTPCPT